MTQSTVTQVVAGGLVVGLLLGGGCKTVPSQSALPTEGPSLTQPSQPSPTSSPASKQEMVPGTIYRAAADCVTFVPQSVELAKDSAVTQAVGKVIESQPAIAASISSYTVQRHNDTATIDFQMRSQAEGGIAALSLCDQFALFGSLRETLVQTPAWGIKTVRFTEGGKELGL